MAEYIEREALMKELSESVEPFNTGSVFRAIRKQAAADVAPVVHGRWEYIPQTLNTLSQLRCPFCGWWSLDPSIDSGYNYCPNCGARMDGDANNE